jgi:hypothetical protein
MPRSRRTSTAWARWTAVTLATTQLLQARDAATEAHSGALSAAASLAFATGALGSAPN